MDLKAEFARQLQNLLDKGYPKLAGITEREFTGMVKPLVNSLGEVHDNTYSLEDGILPFVIVIKSDLVPTDKMMAHINKDDKGGVTKLFPLSPPDFTNLSSVSIPSEPAYLLAGIDRGKLSLNDRPQDALLTILDSKRSPLTIDEGVAIVTHYPEFLIKNNCFSLLASRHAGDKRVPAIWLNGNKNPNLGWCWDGNPHTWLGSASCKSRVR